MKILSDCFFRPILFTHNKIPTAVHTKSRIIFKQKRPGSKTAKHITSFQREASNPKLYSPTMVWTRLQWHTGLLSLASRQICHLLETGLVISASSDPFHYDGLGIGCRIDKPSKRRRKVQIRFMPNSSGQPQWCTPPLGTLVCTSAQSLGPDDQRNVLLFHMHHHV